jgi:hypothetical protein
LRLCHGFDLHHTDAKECLKSFVASDHTQYLLDTACTCAIALLDRVSAGSFLVSFLCSSVRRKVCKCQYIRMLRYRTRTHIMVTPSSLYQKSSQYSCGCLVQLLPQTFKLER